MRQLVFRMSSLGDLILSTAYLENVAPGTEVDWVVSSDFEFVLRGHPGIRKLHVFEKKTGLSGWFRLLRQLSRESYSVRVDLHCTMRTRLARGYFFCSDLLHGRRVLWRAISKQRLRMWGYMSFKRFFPKALRPTPLWMRFARIAGGARPPSFLPILRARAISEPVVLENYGLKSGEYYAFMPASRWRSKEWGAMNYAQVAEALCVRQKAKILLLGRERDFSCVELRNILSRRGISVVSALQENDFAVTAVLLKHAAGYLGSDTGLAHLSEAVGLRSAVIFGPTRPDLGFGPWREESRSIHSDVVCSPCSKDGRFCYRFTGRYECLNRVRPEDVMRELWP